MSVRSASIEDARREGPSEANRGRTRSRKDLRSYRFSQRTARLLLTPIFPLEFVVGFKCKDLLKKKGTRNSWEGDVGKFEAMRSNALMKRREVRGQWKWKQGNLHTWRGFQVSFVSLKRLCFDSFGVLKCSRHVANSWSKSAEHEMFSANVHELKIDIVSTYLEISTTIKDVNWVAKSFVEDISVLEK